MEKKRSTYTDKLVSVIMPMHNSSKFLGKAIESVIHQKYHDWELLIVDDNSTDDSVSIAQQYAAKDSRIQVLRNDRP
ncbi:MAG: glycosyltransferase family 2 protein, partial [Prevotella sp.]|nr:glycosyltransferase family 2 protein [Prevotella sp.]